MLFFISLNPKSNGPLEWALTKAAVCIAVFHYQGVHRNRMFGVYSTAVNFFCFSRLKSRKSTVSFGLIMDRWLLPGRFCGPFERVNSGARVFCVCIVIWKHFFNIFISGGRWNLPTPSAIVKRVRKWNSDGDEGWNAFLWSSGIHDDIWNWNRILEMNVLIKSVGWYFKIIQVRDGSIKWLCELEFAL